MAIKYLGDDEDQNKTDLRPAVKTDQGVISGVVGDHHNDLAPSPPEKDRGFVNASGDFLNRGEASQAARREGLNVPNNLHSENLIEAVKQSPSKTGGVKFLDTPKDSPGPASQKFSEEKAKPPSFWERFGTGLVDIGVGAAKLATLAPDSPELANLDFEERQRDREALQKSVREMSAKREARIQAEREAAGQSGIDWARTAGNVVGTLPLAGLNPLAAGAISGALTPVTEGDVGTETAKQIAYGAAGGKLAELGGNVLSNVLKPTTNAAKKALLEAGVELTPGMVSGKVGKTVEKMMKTLPFTGDVIKGGEARALDSFNVATAKKALEPLGRDVVEQFDAQSGRDAIQKGQQVLNQAYDNALDKVGTFRATPKFIDSMNELEAMSAETMPENLRNQYISILRNRIGSRLQGQGGAVGTMDGRTFKQVESELRFLGQRFKGSGDQGQRDIGHALDAARTNLREALSEQNPEVAKELKNVNKAYSLFSDVERAAQHRAGSQGRFTPSDLLQAIRAGDKSPRNRQFAAGARPLQDWAEKADSVLGGLEPGKDNPPWVKANLVGLGSGVLGLPLASGHTEIGMNALRSFMLGAPKTRNLLANVAQGAGQIAAPGLAGAAALAPDQGNGP